MACEHTAKFRASLIEQGWPEAEADVVVNAADAVDSDVSHAFEVALNEHLHKVPEHLRQYYAATAAAFISDHAKVAHDDMMSQMHGGIN